MRKTENHNSLAINSASYSISTIVSMVLPLVAYLYIARILGPEYFGKVTFAQTFSSYFVVLATLGITNYSQKVCSVCGNDIAALSRNTSEILAISTVMTAISMAIYTVLSLLLFGKSNDVWLYMVFSGVVLFSSLRMDWFLISRERFVFISLRNVASKVLFLIGSFLLVTTQDDYILYGAIVVATSAVGLAIANYIFILKHHMCSAVPWRSLSIKRHLKPILYLSLVTVGSKLFSSTDVIMLGLLCDDTTVGIYGNAIKLPLVLDEVLMAIAAVITPQLYLSVSQGDDAKTHYLMDYASNLMAFFAVPAMILCMVMPAPLVILLGGEEYVSGATILAIYSVVMITTLCLTLAGTRMYIARGQERQLFVILLVSAAVNIILNAVLIPVYDGVGAAIASVISNVFMLVVELSYAHTFKYIFKTDKLKYIVAGLGLLAVLIILRFLLGGYQMLSLAASLFIGGVVYCAILYSLSETTMIKAVVYLKGFFNRRIS